MKKASNHTLRLINSTSKLTAWGLCLQQGFTRQGTRIFSSHVWLAEQLSWPFQKPPSLHLWFLLNTPYTQKHQSCLPYLCLLPVLPAPSKQRKKSIQVSVIYIQWISVEYSNSAKRLLLKATNPPGLSSVYENSWSVTPTPIYPYQTISSLGNGEKERRGRSPGGLKREWRASCQSRVSPWSSCS